MTIGVVFSKPIPIKGKLTTDYINQYYTQIAATFVTYILRQRMKDISMHIEKLQAEAAKIAETLAQYNLDVCTLKEPELNTSGTVCPPPPAPITDDMTDKALDSLEAQIKRITTLESLTVAFTKWGADGNAAAPIYQQLFDDVSGSTAGVPYRRLRIIKGSLNSLFNFSSAPFLHPETGLATVVARLLVLSKSSRPNTIKGQIDKLLVQYFQARDAIKESFFDKDMKAEIESLTDITSGIDSTRVIALAAPDGKQGLIDAIKAVADKYEPPAEVGPVAEVPRLLGGSAQMGGAGSPLQYRDLHDLLAELCLDALLALDIKSDASEALDDIEARWVMGVDELRTTALDDYGVAFEESVATDLISFILSFRTLKTPAGQEAVWEASFASNDRTIYPTMAATIATKYTFGARRDSVIINDISAILLTNLPVEPFILKILSTIGTEIVGNTDKYASEGGWGQLPTAVYVAAGIPEARSSARARKVREAIALVRGGGLERTDDSESNDRLPSSGNGVPPGGRRGLYAGLRKRTGSRTTARVRKSSRSTRRRR
jgi:hypothetical protein